MKAFDELLRAGKIKAIEILCQVESGTKYYEALITTDENKIQTLPIADADSFVLNLDKAIGEFVAQGAPVSQLDKLDIK